MNLNLVATIITILSMQVGSVSAEERLLRGGGSPDSRLLTATCAAGERWLDISVDTQGENPEGLLSISVQNYNCNTDSWNQWPLHSISGGSSWSYSGCVADEPFMLNLNSFSSDSSKWITPTHTVTYGGEVNPGTTGSWSHGGGKGVNHNFGPTECPTPAPTLSPSSTPTSAPTPACLDPGDKNLELFVDASHGDPEGWFAMSLTYKDCATGEKISMGIDNNGINGGNTWQFNSCIIDREYEFILLDAGRDVKISPTYSCSYGGKPCFQIKYDWLDGHGWLNQRALFGPEC